VLIRNRIKKWCVCILLLLFSSQNLPAQCQVLDLSAWVAEWEMKSGLYEAGSNINIFSSFQIFAVYFDENDEPMLSSNLKEWLNDAAKWLAANGNPELYLTVVNDYKREKEVIYKDPNLVWRFLATQESRAKHLETILGLIDLGPFTGIDLDYERVKPSDWSVYLKFCEDLHHALNSRGKKLRVVLEPKREYYTAPFPEGPEYVVMAYNLFGLHTKVPGPKADPKFIVNLARLCRSQMKQLPRFAMATGGFLWRGDGKIEGHNERKMMEIARQERVTPVRDENSQYLVLTYPVKGKNDVGWFADGVTLEYVMETARMEGFETFALWRLGGNKASSLLRLQMNNRSR